MKRIKTKYVLACMRCAKTCDFWKRQQDEETNDVAIRHRYGLIAKIKHCYACYENWDMKNVGNY